MTIDNVGGNIFLYTVPDEATASNEGENKDFGILDIRIDKINSPPKFTEKETLQAMNNLGIDSIDLVPKSSDIYTADSVLQIQIQIENEKKRLVLLEKIIDERQKIIQSDNDGNQARSSRLIVKEKNNLRCGKFKKKRPKRSRTVDNKVPIRKNVNFRYKKSRNPTVQPKSFDNNKRIIGRRTNMNNLDKEAIKSRMVIELKRQNEQKHIESALKALARLEEVEKRQMEIRKKQQEIIREKAEKRMRKLRKIGVISEGEFIKRRENVRLEMFRQERALARLHARQRKRYEQEKRSRQERIYKNTITSKHSSESQFEELRKKLITSKSSYSNNVDQNSFDDSGSQTDGSANAKFIRRNSSKIEKRESLPIPSPLSFSLSPISKTSSVATSPFPKKTISADNLKKSEPNSPRNLTSAPTNPLLPEKGSKTPSKSNDE